MKPVQRMTLIVLVLALLGGLAYLYRLPLANLLMPEKIELTPGQAVRLGDVDRLRAMLMENQDLAVERRGEEENTLLHVAARFGHVRRHRCSSTTGHRSTHRTRTAGRRCAKRATNVRWTSCSS